MKDIPFPIYEESVERYVIPESHDDEVKYILGNVTLIALDTETYYNPLIRGVTKFIDGSPNNCPFCLTITYDLGGGELHSIYVDEEHIPLYAPVIESKDITKILHNSKYDRHMLKNIGIDLSGYIWDTMIMIHLIDEEHVCKTPGGGHVRSKALKNLAYHYLNEDGHKYEDLVNEVRRALSLRRGCAKKMVSYKDAAEACPLIMKDYACSDTEFTYELYHIFYKELVRQELLIAYRVDINATYAVFNTERNGIKVDLEYFKALDAELKDEMATCTSLICTIIPKELNINSSNDLVKGFEGIGVEWKWFTDKGEHQTSDTVLTGLIKHGTMEQAILASCVLSYREASKLSGTFIAQIFQYVQWDGRIHPDFNVCPNERDSGGTKTGRLSSSSPNLQNIPEKDKRIERGFVPEEGYVLVKFDYKAQEYRLLGHYSQDENFLQGIRDGLDVHIVTAQLMLKISYEEAAKKANRSKGKTLNFASVYGIGLAALAASLGLKIDANLYKQAGIFFRGKGYVPWNMPAKEILLQACETDEQRNMVEYYFSEEAVAAIDEAGRVREMYFAQFPRIKVFIKECTAKAKQRGWVKTWTGRRRHFKNPKEEGYKGPNSVIQGGCGDITKTKMWETDLFLADYKSRSVNNIHDALMFEIHKSELYILRAIKAILCDLPQFSVPMDVDAEMSEVSWGDMEKFEV